MKIHKNLVMTTGMIVLMLLCIGIGTGSEDIIVAEAGGPYTVYEGVPITINAAGSSGPGILNYSWDFNGDGKYEVYGFEITRTPRDGPLTRTITLNVSNETGASATNTTTWTIMNVNPIVHVGPSQIIDEGDTAYFYINFSDVQVDMNQSTIQINYGDGNTENAVASPSGKMVRAYTYTNVGTYTVTVTITDKDGGIGSDTLTVTVNHANPVVDHVPPPVNQKLGLYDTDIVNFKKSYACRNCHPGANTIHHMVTGYNCNACHPNGYSVEDIDINCLNCHSGSAYYANPNLILGKPHHNTTKGSSSSIINVAYWAIDRKCKNCHGDGYLDSYNDGHYISPMSTSMTSSVCNNCHSQDLSLNRPIIANSNIHHNATSETLGFQCTYCHANSGNNFPIKECEQCHSFRDLHNIETASLGRNLAQTLADEIPGYGHIGNNSDCKGCHGVGDHGDNCIKCHPLPIMYPTNYLYKSKISGTKFNDSNRNGIKDPDEPGVYGISINITRMIPPDIEVDSRTVKTDYDGDYIFANLSAGWYKVREVGVSAGSQTYPASGMPHYVTIVDDETVTGINFGNDKLTSAGKISGKVFDDIDSNGVIDIGENGISGIKVSLYPSGMSTTTNSTGGYIFNNVPSGSYSVYEQFITGYVTTTPTSVGTYINPGETSIVNFGNTIFRPKLPDVSIPQAAGYQSGIPLVNRPGLNYLRISKNLSGVSNVLGVNLTLRWFVDGTMKTAIMTQIGTTGVWEAVLNSPFSSGTAVMTFTADVDPVGPGVEDIIQIGDIIFVDPSGQIRSACNNEPIESATVTLYVESPPTTGNFIVSPPEYQIEQNPQVTLSDGYYGWMTRPGTYKVNVTKDGYNSNESEPVNVPPPRTGLDILLTPTKGCPPVQEIIAEAGGPYTVYEGTPITINASGSSGPSGDILNYEWIVETNKVIGFEIMSTPRDGPLTSTIVLNVSNGKGGFGTDSALWNVINVNPVINQITSPVDPQPITSMISVSSQFTDAGILDTHTAILDWDDGNTSAGTVTESEGSGLVTADHKYSTPGVYTVTLTVTDKDGGTVTATSQLIIVYDPEGGFVTGGGWINSPVGAYIINLTLTGKANFGFISKYSKGATVPSGETEFQFKTGYLNFHSSSYDWLVIAGARAQYKGSGTINGEGDYAFMLTAIDGQVNGGGETDKFRMKIWNKTTGEKVYDNQNGATDDAEPTTAIAGGSIVVHK